MTCSERIYSADFKARLVIELLEGKKDAAQIAEENSIPLELLLSWKDTFLEKAPAVFDKKGNGRDKRELARISRAKKAYARKAEKLARQIEWVEKMLAEEIGPDWEKKFSPRPF